MDLDENDVSLDLRTIELNPREKIRVYFEKLRNEIETHYEDYLFNGDKNGNMKYKNLDATDRIEINYKKDKMLEIVDQVERFCFSSKNEKKFSQIANKLKEVHDKMVKVSHGFFYDEHFLDKKGHLISNNDPRLKCIEIEYRLKKELTDIDSQLFLNRMTFFVRNKIFDIQKVPRQIFGYLITLDYFLNENELDVLKKQLEFVKDLKNKSKIKSFQVGNTRNSRYQEEFGDDIKMNVLNYKMITLLKLYDYLLEKIKDDHEEFITVTDKQVKKILINDDLYMQYDRSDIDYIEPGTFALFKRLLCLDLYANNLRLIEVDTFKGLSSLESLILSNNKINLIQQDSFKHLINLTDLYMDSNNFIKLSKNVFDGLNSLQKLSLAKNGIERIEHFGKFGGSCLENLIYLNLNENNITSIESNSFKSLVNLNSLYLVGNKITIIKKFAFVGLNKLIKLSLSNNFIDTIEQNAMDGLANLDSLSLKNNRLTFLGYNCFVKLVNLKNLDVSFNFLEACKNFSFEGVNKGVLLNLSNNLIDSEPYELELLENQANEYKVFLIK